MKILLAHNRYVNRGGEDAVFEQERDLLRSHGHEVIEYIKDNRDVGELSKLRLAASSIWARDSYAELTQLMERTGPEIVHVHNTLPLISPAIYYAAGSCGVPVVQTLHNYRLLCANALLMRDSVVCEDCVGKAIAWPAVKYSCYRGNRAATLSVVTSLALHRAAGTYQRRVARYIALCKFSRDKLLLAGLPEDRVVVKPNFTKDRHGQFDLQGPRSGALFVGRLSEEKGVNVLLAAWQNLEVELQVIGGGNLDEMRKSAPPAVQFRGFVSDEDLAVTMRRAAFIVMPSLVYEGFPMVVAEAFAAGVPIIASRIGALAELVEDGVTGLHFTAGDPADLANKVRWATDNAHAMRAMGARARTTYESRYTPEANYVRLMEIYREAQATSAAVGCQPDSIKT